MSILTSAKKLVKRFFKKESGDIVVEGGLEMLSRLTSGSMSPTGLLERYKKSLYVFACVSKIAEKVAAIPLEMYRVINSSGDVKELTAHPALDLLYKCNPFQTRSEFWEIAIINLKCTGDAFWYKVRNSSGKVVELWNLRPDLMTVVTDPTRFVKQYELRKNDGTKEVFAPEDIIHLKTPDPLNQHMGMSPLKAALSRVESEENMNAYQRDFFLNSARPDAVIKNPALALDAQQKEDLREGWDRRFRGRGNGSKIAVLDGGLEYQVISLTQKEMDYIESLKFTRDDILVAFKMSKSVLGITEDVNRANAEAGLAIFLGETIKPEIERIVEKLNEELISQDFGPEFFIDFEDPTPKNREQQRADLTGYTAANIMLINEARAELGLPPVVGGWSLYMPMLQQAVGGLPQQGAKIGGGDTEDAAYYGGRPARKTKKFDFRGHYWLKVKLQMREAMMEGVEKMATVASKTKRKGKAKRKMSFIKAEIQADYAAAQNKAVDQKSVMLAPEMNAFANGQLKRVLEALEARNGKAHRRKMSGKDVFDMGGEVELAIEFITPKIRAMLEEAGVRGLDLVGPAETFNPDSKEIQKFIKARAKEFAESVNSTTLDKLDRTLAEGIAGAEGINDLRARVESVYEEFPSYRSELIARTEATAANNQGLLEGFRQSGVANAKEWINAGDDRVRDEHQNGIGVGGEIVLLDAVFSNGLSTPSEPNCRCVIGPAFLEQ